MRRFAFAALAAATVAVPAVAQDTAAAVNQAPFTGARVEGLIGWDRVQNNGHDDALTYGVGVGYDVQFGGALVGLEGELNDSDARVCDGARSAVSPRVCVKAARDLYIGARVGKVINDRALIYAKAGYTNARFKATSDNGSTESTLFRSDLDGLRVGAGVEYALNQNMFLKTEYRYSNYERGLERHQVVGGFGFRF